VKFQTEDTGIEKRLTYTASTDDDKRRLLAHAKRLIDREHRNWRKDAERLARTILESTTAIPAAKRDAGELVCVLSELDRACKAGDGPASLWLAYKVGQWIESLQNRRQEHHAARGRKRSPHDRAFHERTHGTQDDKLARWQLVRAEWNSIRAKYPAWSASAVDGETAKRMNTSSRTVQNVRLKYLPKK